MRESRGVPPVTRQLELAERLADGPVNESIVASLHTFLRGRPTAEMLDLFLAAMPHSPIASRSRSTGPQVRELLRRVRPLVEEARRIQAGEEAAATWLSGLLGWTRRLMVGGERGRSNDGRGGPGQGGHGRWQGR